MMKSFFKKLAFVMALAMVVTLAAPAGSALAAEAGVSLQGTKTIVTAYELNEVGATVDFSFQGAPKDWKTTYKWASSDEAVATVDKAGVVTAVAAGTATITITAGADASYSHAVVVTVKEPVKAVDFEITQIDTVTAKLTFNEVADLSKATVDDFTVTAIDEMFEYTLFANTLAVKDNVATLTFVEGVLTDGAIIKIGYAGVEKALVASNGEVNSVAVSYGMNKNYAGDAYVYTELDPDYVLLSYKLYDAKGIDVTANYEENVDYTIEWALTNGGDYASEPEEDADNGWQMSFDKKGAATVKAIVTFTDEDGEDKPVESLPTTIIAKDRPAIAFTYNKAGVGVFGGWYANTYAMANSFNDPNGTVWEGSMSWAMANNSIEKGQSGWFSAKLTDNRGKELTTTKLTYKGASGWDLLSAEGNTEYKDYGYFVYESSNEDILDIDEEGRVTAVEVGSATILVSFVAYSEDGEEKDPVKVCSKRVNVTTNFPEPYAKTFEFYTDALTLTSTGDSVEGTLWLKFYDQYGRIYDAFDANDLNTASAITVPSTYPEAAEYFVFGEKDKAWYTGDQWAYPVVLRGDDLNELVDIKDNGYTTFKFTVEFDKDLDEFSKIVTKSDKATAKVYNVDEYYADLVEFYSTTVPATNEDSEFVKWNWASYGSATVDTYVDKRTEFENKSTGSTTTKTIGVNLNSAAGLKLMPLPESHFIELTKADKVDKINKLAEEKRVLANGDKLVEGAIYYQISYPKDYANVTTATGSSVSFTFNDITTNPGEVKAATEGTYSVALYYVNSKNKLVKLGSNPVAISVKNSTPAVKAEGFKTTNVYDGTINAGNIDEVLAKVYNFSWNGELLYDEDRSYTESPNFEIYSVVTDPIKAGDTKVVVKEIVFKIDYFNDCVAENGSVTNNADGNYQYFTLKKRITIKTDN